MCDPSLESKNGCVIYKYNPSIRGDNKHVYKMFKNHHTFNNRFFGQFEDDFFLSKNVEASIIFEWLKKKDFCKQTKLYGIKRL